MAFFIEEFCIFIEEFYLQKLQNMDYVTCDSAGEINL